MQSVIARTVDLNQSTVYRWQTTPPNVSSARKFAAGYRRPLLEVFMAAGFITEREIEGEPPALDAVTEMRLIADRVLQLAATWEDVPQSITWNDLPGSTA